MTQLPVLSGRQLVRRLRRLGWEVDRQTGSHMIMRQVEAPHRRVTVPDHRALAKGTLRAILRHAKITVQDLTEAE